MKRLLILSAVLIACQLSYGQGLVDAYRYSNNIYTGSARFAGMAGSFGALGGDFSVASTNPAGLGIYRTSDFSFTPSFNFNKASSSYLGMTTDENRFAFGISSIGLVSTFQNPTKTDGNHIFSFNFGIGYNKLKDFNSNVLTSGYNNQSSITDQFAVDANDQLSGADAGRLSFTDNGPSPFDSYSWETVMAWNNFLIDTTNNTNTFNSVLREGEAVYQNKSLTTRGSIGEYVLSFAGNVAEKFFFGGTIGIQDIYYKNGATYTEDGEAASPSGFNNMTYRQTFETIGSGFNLKLGVIFKPIQEIRLGVAFHTPTFYNLRDKYSSYMRSEFNYGLPIDPIDSPYGEYEYNLVTPYRLILSAGGLLLDRFAYNVEYEMVDYSVMRLRDGGDGYDFRSENNDISRVFGSSSNLRGGLEYHEGPLFLRGGYAYYGSPIKSGYPNHKSNTQVFAAGIGIRTGTFYTDFAFNKITSKDDYFMYGDQDLVKVKDKNTQNQFILTFGYKF